MEKIKILQACDVYLPDVDGVINCMHNYALNLCDKADITLIAPKNKKSHIDNQPYSVIRCNSAHVPILNAYYGFPSQDQKFKKLVMANDYDIIHIHSPFNMAKYALSVAKKKNIPIVATFHSNMWQIFFDIFKTKSIATAMTKELGKIYNKCDEVFVCSEPVANQLRSYGYTGKITYLPFGTDFKRCDNVEQLSLQANKEFSLSPEQPIFIFVGRVMKMKRVDFILDALKIVKSKGIDFKFFVVGKGQKLKQLQSYAQKLGLNDNVVFTGFLDRSLFPLINARANLLLFPSIYDNFGLVKVEAAAYHTPGVFIKDSCAAYGVTDGKNGFLSNDTPEDFAQKICEAVADREKLHAIGDNASEELYISWEECSDILLNRLKQIIREKSEK